MQGFALGLHVVNLLERLIQLRLQLTDLLALLSQLYLVWVDDAEIGFANLSFPRSHDWLHGSRRWFFLDSIGAPFLGLFFDLLFFWFFLDFSSPLLLFAVQNLLYFVWVLIVAHDLAKCVIKFKWLVPLSFRRLCFGGL